MKKVFVTGIVLIAFVIYAIIYHRAIPLTAGRNMPVIQLRNSTNGLKSSLIQSPKDVFKDGSYTGSAADAFYGTIQVKTVIQNRKIVDVQFLQYPNSQDESVQINQEAMPVLKQEAIQAQSAKVEIVSGATQTSQAFQQSLASALNQAK